ncbi:MAG: hypothetical protein ABWZ25_00115 [Chitinophagaceae bacterium]
MDNLNYAYTAGTNRLRQIRDTTGNGIVVPSDNYADDLDDQAADNYQYDLNGNLTRDAKNRISQVNGIFWTPNGKILKISKDLSNVPPGSATAIDYEYDVSGNRLASMQTKSINGTTTYDYTFYVRDAQGNVMAEYEKRQQGGAGTLLLKRHYIYGSNRMGLINRELNADAPKGETGSLAILGAYEKDEALRGARNYELRNHLGNVLLTISDLKTSVVLNGAITASAPVVMTANDYFPGGMLIPGRKYNASVAADHKFGFNGKENDNYVKDVEGTQQDYGMRIYRIRDVACRIYHQGGQNNHN